ncbi:MAG: putative Ig domain-containing protein [Armatimonadota bacterium]
MATTKHWVDTVYLSDDGFEGADTELISLGRPLNLAPGADYTQNPTVTLPPVPAGQYWLIVKVDSGNSQPETDESDNLLMAGPVEVRVMDVPVIADIPDAAVSEGTPYQGPTPVLESGTLPVTWTLVTGPQGMTINPATGVVSWPNPQGSSVPYTITIRAANEAGFDTETWQLTVPISYTATVAADIDEAPAGTPVHFSGSAKWVAGGNPAAGVNIAIRVLVKETRRVFRTQTDAAGNFNYTFYPLPNEAGHYGVAADHPGVVADNIQDEFVLYGMAVEPVAVSEDLIPNAEVVRRVNLRNLGDVPLTNITATVRDLHPSIVVQVSAPSSLAADETATLEYSVVATGTEQLSGTFRIVLESQEGAATVLPLSVRVRPLTAVLRAVPSRLDAAMLRGAQTLVQFEVENAGGASSTNLEVALPSAPWMALATPAVIEPIAPGGKASVVLSLTPDQDLALGPYEGSIVVGGLPVPFRFQCVSDRKGDLEITAVDELTYYAEGSPNVANADITLTRVDDPSVVVSGTTNENGVALFTDLTEAYYTVKVQAAEHGPFVGTVLVEASKTRSVLAFLPRQLVTYIWKVVPTQIEDRYKIIVEAVFETNVPVPVVTVEPANIDLNEMVGGKLQVDLTITNHGLVAADDVELQFGDNPRFKFKPLVDKIGRLAANSSVVVPLTVIDTTIIPDQTPGSRLLSSTADQGPAPAGSGDPCVKLKSGVAYILKCGDDAKWKWVPINVTYPEWVCG